MAVAKLSQVQAEVKPSGKLHIENLSDRGFDVRITDVAAGAKTIQEVVVPVWSVKDNQDDLQWLSAQRQADGSFKTHVAVSDHKNDHGDYIVHLYYKIDGKLVGVAGTTTSVPAPSPVVVRPDLPASGRYTFTERVSIKSEPRVAAAELAYYDKGMAVNYDKVLTADGYTWLSYLSYNGNRRYVAIAKEAVVPQSQETRHNLPASGRYTFTANAGIKTEPRLASSDITYFAPGMSVNYDRVLNADGYTWISYVSYGGRRLYVALTPSQATTVEQPSATPSSGLPASGRYTFTGRSPIKAEASLGAPELAYYEAGMSVNYDKVLKANGRTWLSYLSYNGNRRYVLVA